MIQTLFALTLLGVFEFTTLRYGTDSRPHGDWRSFRD